MLSDSKASSEPQETSCNGLLCSGNNHDNSTDFMFTKVLFNCNNLNFLKSSCIHVGVIKMTVSVYQSAAAPPSKLLIMMTVSGNTQLCNAFVGAVTDMSMFFLFSHNFSQSILLKNHIGYLREHCSHIKLSKPSVYFSSPEKRFLKPWYWLFCFSYSAHVKICLWLMQSICSSPVGMAKTPAHICMLLSFIC